MTKDLTIVFYTANKISNYFFKNVKKQLLKAARDIPIISVSQKPINLGYNLCCGDLGQSQINIYRQVLRGVVEAETKYVAMAEDDILYSREHFNIVPNKGFFTYDRNIWNIYTWTKPPMFSWKGRRNLNGLVCERELFIKAMNERFSKYTDDDYPKHLFGEPGKYERQLGVTVQNWEFYKADKPSIAFSHPTELSYAGLGRRKKIGGLARTELDGWGNAENILKLYKK